MKLNNEWSFSAKKINTGSNYNLRVRIKRGQNTVIGFFLNGNTPKEIIKQQCVNQIKNYEINSKIL